MIDVLAEFVTQLRASGIPVSTSESIEAARAIEVIGALNRTHLRAALSSTMVKNAAHIETFNVVFDVYFFPGREETGADDDLVGATASGGAGAIGAQSDAELSELLFRALLGRDLHLQKLIAAESVSRFADIQPGRPSGLVLYRHRTLKAIDLDAVLYRLLAASTSSGLPSELTTVSERITHLRVEKALDGFRREVESEVRRRLVADRGADAVARTLRLPVPEDIEFRHASAEQVRMMQRAMTPLSKTLAARLAMRQRARGGGRLDMRATIRKSLASGGVPIDFVVRPPRPHKPEIVVIADVSGSVAAFASFTLQFISALSGRFARVRSFMFIDGVAEVTSYVKESRDVVETVKKVRDHAPLIWMDGHTDYGHVFESFIDQWGRQISPHTTVIILGDARSNYRPPAIEALRNIRRRTQRVIWLNPEPKRYWDSGDSIISGYAAICDDVFECRNLRQLEHFVSGLRAS